MSVTLLEHFSSIEDPRIDRHKLHTLSSIIFLTICAVLSGCNDWDEIEEYGIEKEEWLKKYVEFPNGIPSHDTINRVFARLKPQELQNCFIDWVQCVVSKSKHNIVNIDGKRLCNGGENGSKSMIHLVNAWSSSNQMILGQVKTEEKSNEITAIPILLDLLELEGAIVTMDAMGCQTTIAEKIVAKGADYVLAVKENQKFLHDDIKDAFAHTSEVVSHTTTEKGHGRIEKRTCKVITDMVWIAKQNSWKNLQSIISIETQRTLVQTGESSTEQRFYIASLLAIPEYFNQIIRGHWSIENNLHWCLDVVFKEDIGTKQAGNAAENFSMINKAALSILKNDRISKSSLKRKRLRAGWSNEYLETLINREI
ncbi:MAG: ISAs1 family transposase [Pseudomonadota bacterium]|jgi:predicted transposase YbfD/YdcC